MKDDIYMMQTKQHLWKHAYCNHIKGYFAILDSNDLDVLYVVAVSPHEQMPPAGSNNSFSFTYMSSIQVTVI